MRYTTNTIKNTYNQLSKLTENFTEEQTAVRCWTLKEAREAKNIFLEHYYNVKIKKGKNGDYIIKGTSPKYNDILTEAADEDILDSIDFNKLDDPNDSLDMQDEGTGNIDDASEVEAAKQITILKKRAADLAKKYKETYKQISDLARKLNLTTSKDKDSLEIDLKDMSGDDADLDDDLDKVREKAAEAQQDNDYSDEEMSEDEIDDDFGPSEYDSRAKELEDSEEENEDTEE